MTNSTKKVLLMGRAGAGKTSMRSIIFANYLARETKRLTTTNNIEHSHLRFLGNLVLSLWDCGGQDTFMENYFESQRELIFRNAEVLIYVLEARSDTVATLQVPGPRQREYEKDVQYFKTACESVRQFSPRAKIFYLVHKFDLVAPAEKEAMLQMYEDQLSRYTEGLDTTTFGTSIWDETLFRAWSSIAYSLVPNICYLEKHLQHFCDVAEADEVILFEKSTFLVISAATRKAHPDGHRFEKISNICKQFKLTCARAQSNFSSLTVQNSSVTTYIERFTQNTYIMLISSDKAIRPGATLCNIDYARDYFEKTALAMKLGPTL